MRSSAQFTIWENSMGLWKERIRMKTVLIKWIRFLSEVSVAVKENKMSLYSHLVLSMAWRPSRSTAPLKGGLLAAWRILRCNPLFPKAVTTRVP